ncbi:hypothetical protein K439DRAFT_1381529 [Ramaria rubella]|nr:hypothetical protein K439DRAFT_1381529 [Ramaria rubella]
MTMLHSEPSSGANTHTLCLTSRTFTPSTFTPSHILTPTATLAKATAKLVSLSMQPMIHADAPDESGLDQLDVEAELRADGEHPFPIDRRLVKEVVQQKLGVRVERVRFLSAGTFHKAFLLHLDTRHLNVIIPHTVVFRIARRNMHMPRLKTESEVATLAYLRTRTSVPVPTVYWYDANPYNALGGEWMVMSKAQGLPLSRFYHTLPQEVLRTLLSNLASMLIPLFEHRFPAIGSLYFSETSHVMQGSPPGTVPLIAPLHLAEFTEFTPGPIISYPFFGSSRGLLSHLTKPREINRGPWTTFPDYLDACVQREINGVVREGQGRQVGRRPRVAPMSEEGSGSSSESDEEDDDDWGVNWSGPSQSRTSSFGNKFGPSDFDSGDTDSDSETSSSGTGDAESYYRDYRATQRSTFLVAHTTRREASVREEMGVFLEVMGALREEAEGGLGLGECGERGNSKRRRMSIDEDVAGEDTFTLDPHDLSLENVFVDEHDHSKITCIIDWESTCIRPLFQAAHLPTFLQPHHGHGHHHGHHHTHTHTHSHHRSHGPTPHRPHMSRAHSSSHAQQTVHTPLPRYVPSHSSAAQIFRDEIARLGGRAASQWLQLEQTGAKRRWAHRVVEWDGWEEGLAGEILGELEYGWEIEASGGAVDGRRTRKDCGQKADRDVSADGGRELGRRLEQWVEEGATITSYHDEEA